MEHPYMLGIHASHARRELETEAARQRLLDEAGGRSNRTDRLARIARHLAARVSAGIGGRSAAPRPCCRCGAVSGNAAPDHPR